MTTATTKTKLSAPPLILQQFYHGAGNLHVMIAISIKQKASVFRCEKNEKSKAKRRAENIILKQQKQIDQLNKKLTKELA